MNKIHMRGSASATRRGKELRNSHEWTTSRRLTQGTHPRHLSTRVRENASEGNQAEITWSTSRKRTHRRVARDPAAEVSAECERGRQQHGCGNSRGHGSV